MVIKPAPLFLKQQGTSFPYGVTGHSPRRPLRSPVRFDGVLPVRVEGFEPGFQFAVAVLGRHGLERIAIGRGLAEQVLGLTVAHAHAFGLNRWSGV